MKEEVMTADPRAPENRGKATLNEMFDENDLKYDPDEDSYDKVFVGKVDSIKFKKTYRFLFLF
jgi:hypothetical protein